MSKNENENNKSIVVFTEQVHTLSIIGSSGRKYDESLVSKELYDKLLNTLEGIILDDFKLNYEEIILVSGGAAFCDHLAVTLFNKYKDKFAGLVLYLPCGFDYENEQYEDNGDTRWYNNPGKLSNNCHYKFMKKTGINSLQEIADLESNNKVILDIPEKVGFHGRNTKVAKSNYLVAFTRGNKNNKDGFADGGTYDTWKKAKNSTKIHMTFDNIA